jgi:hypothetical protein
LKFVFAYHAAKSALKEPALISALFLKGKSNSYEASVRGIFDSSVKLVHHSKQRTQIESSREQSAEESIWTLERRNNAIGENHTLKSVIVCSLVQYYKGVYFKEDDNGRDM